MMHSRASGTEKDPECIEGQDFWYVYIAQSRSGRYYVGITNNVEKRIEDHNRGKGSRLAQVDGPFILKYYSQKLPNKSAARKAEIKIKKWSRAKKEKLISGQ